MIGNFHLTAAGAADSWKRRRIEYDASQGSTSVNQMMQINKTLAAANEYGLARRAASAFYRLHAAKYLKMDPMLKELFFPILNYKQSFGFTSVSCINQGEGQTGTITGMVATDNRNKDTGLDDPKDEIQWAKPRGPFRGFACFTLRSSRIAEPGDGSTTQTVGKLNTKQEHVGGSNLWSGNAGVPADKVYSHYRRFFNGPVLKSSGVAATADGNAQQVQMQDCPAVASHSTPEKNSQISVNEVGYRGSLERIAARACPFVPSNRLYRGPTQLQPPSSSGSQAPPDTQTYRLLNDSGKYYQNVLHDNFRISDGYLEMDISNGKVAPVLIEVVIHSFKKQFHEASANTLISNLFQSIWQSVQMSQRQGVGQTNLFDTIAGTDINNDNVSGGWQAFYDPSYPLLKTRKSMDQHSDSIASEVHRSTHVLSPGQTKLVRVNLGSLYYALGGQTKAPGTVQSNAQAFSQQVPKMGPGSLMVSIGHSGFEMLSAPAVEQDPKAGLYIYPDSTNEAGTNYVLPGSGFWVGKQHTASEIVVSGKYCEKFYPMQPGTNPGERILAAPKPGIPYVLHENLHLGLPAMQPATDVIATTSANDQSYPGNSVSGDRPGTGMETDP